MSTTETDELIVNAEEFISKQKKTMDEEEKHVA
jgi:hypothetical protein